MKPLRPYQREALDSIYTYWDHSDGNPLVVLPTGTGKSLVAATFCREVLSQWPDTRILIVTHVKELIAQNYAELIDLWPDAPAGIYSAGLGRRNIGARILFCGIQSIHKRAIDLQLVDLILIDEAHLVPDTGATMYRKFIAALTSINPRLKVIGLTATPYRLGQGLLTDGDNALFTGIAYDYGLLRAISEGYLSPIIGKHMATTLDTSGVGTRLGEFNATELEAAVDQADITRAAVAEMVQYGEQDRHSWLVFCAGTKHSEHVRDEVREQGFSAEMILGDTPSGERARIIDAFKRREIRCITNANVLTTGFNAPGVDLIAFIRPTKSAGLLVQMAGRGTRLHPGKQNCIILDFAGNIARHGPIDMIEPKSTKKGTGDAPVKVCPECETLCFAGVRVCPECHYEFPPPKLEISKTAGREAILSSQIEPEWIEVKSIFYRRHEKTDKPTSMCVEYFCGLTIHREWICLEHTGYPRAKACGWWQKRTQSTPVPNTVDEAIERQDEIKVPTAILVKPIGRFTEIINTRF